MLKRHRKLKRLWRNSQVLSMIAGKLLTTEAFDKELIKIIKTDLIKQESFKKLIDLKCLIKNLPK